MKKVKVKEEEEKKMGGEKKTLDVSFVTVSCYS